MRIDKFLVSQGVGTRREVQQLVKNGSVKVNDIAVKKPNAKVIPEKDVIFVNGKKISYMKNIYIVMNKPAGVISATEDKSERTVIDILPDNLKRKDLFPAGRLDKDTTGLLIITDDGDFAHRILSPKKHVNKRYLAVLSGDVTDEMIVNFKNGIKFNDGTLCKPAKLTVQDNRSIAEVVISEGKFHQVKKMFITQGLEVLKLKRLQIGGFVLPSELCEGDCRLMSEDEIVGIFS
ncbi:MAG: rRNA pseudouridine synthase [Ruminococcus sp.]|nr:rRNA pseudouridine synthase [Ruminococcus sp.]